MNAILQLQSICTMEFVKVRHSPLILFLPLHLLLSLFSPSSPPSSPHSSPLLISSSPLSPSSSPPHPLSLSPLLISFLSPSPPSSPPPPHIIFLIYSIDIVIDCPSYCSSCNSTSCITCDAGFELNDFENVCVCPQAYTFVDGSCQFSDSMCAKMKRG
jgi:hypothetical protein